MSIQEFIALVKNRMEEKNTNAVQLAKKTGLSPTYLYLLLKQKKRWNETTLSIVCQELGIDIEFKAKQ